MFYRDSEQTFFEAEEFPWGADIEPEWMAVRKELDLLMLDREQITNFQDYSPPQKSIANDNHWKIFFLDAFGHVEKENCACCPETVRILKEILQMNTAMFSILPPGKYIPSRRGPYKEGAPLSPRIDDLATGTQLQDSSGKRHQALERGEESDF